MSWISKNAGVLIALLILFLWTGLLTFSLQFPTDDLSKPWPYILLLLQTHLYTGLFHTAILYPTRKDLAIAFKRLIDANYPITGASDHGVSEALYLNDPDQNAVELYWDRPKAEWPKKPDGGIEMYTKPLDLEGLLKELA